MTRDQLEQEVSRIVNDADVDYMTELLAVITEYGEAQYRAGYDRGRQDEYEHW